MFGGLKNMTWGEAGVYLAAMWTLAILVGVLAWVVF